MHTRILVVAKDHDMRTVLDPLLHLYGMVALRASDLDAARGICMTSDVHAVILQAGACGVGPALDCFTALRCSARHNDTPLVLLTSDGTLQDDELLGARAVEARVFKYPRQLDAILEYVDSSASSRSVA